MQAAPTTLFLVEDSAPLRERLRDLMKLSANIRVVGEAATPDEAIDGILATRPDVVLLDYELSDGTGVAVLRALSGTLTGTVFVMLTNHIDAHTRRVCEAAGARFFLDKSTEFTRIGAIVAQLRTENATQRGAASR